MKTPEAADLFLNAFAHTLSGSEDGVCNTINGTDWGRLWIACTRAAGQIADAQGTADAAVEVIERTPLSWTPED